VSSFTAERLREYFQRTYHASNLVVAAAGHLDHAALKAMVEKTFADVPPGRARSKEMPPEVTPGFLQRHKDIEQSHVCLGTPGYRQAHDDRHALYVLNTILGGSMSSRLFQNIREERGLAYAVWSSLTTYSDAGAISVYAGCATDKVNEVIDLTLTELRTLRQTPVPADELQRAKDHLKGSLMLSLESTSSRMSQLAREELYFGRHFTLDELLSGFDTVTGDDVMRVAAELFRDGASVATVVGPDPDATLSPERLRV
jgi:predicted Zn-dependent peptidase